MPVAKMELSWITVADLDKAVDFYKNVLGLEVAEKNDMFGWAEMRGKDGGAVLGLAQHSDMAPMEPGAGAIVTMNVEDIEKARTEIAEKGATLHGEVLEVPGHVKLQLFTDSDGNKMQLVEKLA